MPTILTLVHPLQPVLPPSLTVLVLADREVWSPRLWPARRLIPGPGWAWVGDGIAFKAGAKRQPGPLLGVWDAAHPTPWVLLTDLPPTPFEVGWYGLRVWLELGCRALQGVGWPWPHTRRTEPTRVIRH